MKLNPDFGCTIIDAVWTEIGATLQPDYWFVIEQHRRRPHKPAHWSLIEDKLRYLAHECVFVYGRMIMELAHKLDARLPAAADHSCRSRGEMAQLCFRIANTYDARRLRIAKEGLIMAVCAAGIDPSMTPLDDALRCIRPVLKATVIMIDCLPADLRDAAAQRLAEAAFDTVHTLVSIAGAELGPATVYWNGKRCVVRQRGRALREHAVANADAARHATLFAEHPCVHPDMITFNAVYDRIQPPSELDSAGTWMRFRDDVLRPMMTDHPNDPNLPSFFKQANLILAWRATIAPENRFWRADSDSDP